MTTGRTRIHDPAMCCSTGVCGPTVGPELMKFARDVVWLKHHGADGARSVARNVRDESGECGR